MTRTVNIIGAGPGGRAAAMLLARSGLRVRVFEKKLVPGGRTSTLCTEDGFRFDIGPTFFLYPQILERIFSDCGRDLRQEVELVRLDPQYRLVFGAGGELWATPDAARMEAEVRRLAPEDAGAFTRFMADNREKFRRFAPFLQQSFQGWADLFSPDLLRLVPLLRPWRSLDAELGDYFSDERIRLAFTFQSKYLGMSPFRCPSLFSILSFLEYEHGVFHPIGGCGAISAAMARVAADLGVEFHYGEPVEGMHFAEGRVVAVTTRSGEHPADATVVNADFARTMTRLVPDALRSRWTDRRIASKRFSCSTFMLYLGIDGRYDWPHHTIYLSKNYRANLAAIEGGHAVGDDPSLYVQNASVTDPTLAPAGMSTLYVLVPVAHEHAALDWSREGARLRDLTLSRLEQLGLAGLRNRIRHETMITPDDWRDVHEIHLGATFNLSHDLTQMLHLRPRNRFEDVGSMYLVGGGTHPGSGLPVIYSSARITSRLVLEDLGISVPPHLLEEIAPPGPERPGCRPPAVPSPASSGLQGGGRARVASRRGPPRSGIAGVTAIEATSPASHS
jgi:phytoene desaturase